MYLFNAPDKERVGQETSQHSEREGNLKVSELACKNNSRNVREKLVSSKVQKGKSYREALLSS